MSQLLSTELDFCPTRLSDEQIAQYHSRVVGDDEYNEIFVEADGSPASCAAATRRGF